MVFNSIASGFESGEVPSGRGHGRDRSFFRRLAAACVRRIGATQILVAVALGGCAAPPAGQQCTQPRTVTLTYSGDPRFTPAERKGIEKAMQSWRDFSNGRVMVSVVWGGSGGPELRRHVASDEWTKEKTQSIGYTFAGLEQGLTIDIVADLTEGLYWEVAAHEIGHAAGMRLPDCDPKKEDCKHLGLQRSVMAPALNGSTAFSVYDYWMCKESCLCD